VNKRRKGRRQVFKVNALSDVKWMESVFRVVDDELTFIIRLGRAAIA
jgi:hypothetical protein